MPPEAFRDLRRQLGLSQARLAELLEVNRRQIIRYEAGQVDIPRVVELAMETLARQISHSPS